jgi:hypothetical protein
VHPSPAFVTEALFVPVTILVVSAVELRTQQRSWLNEEAPLNIILYVDTKHAIGSKRGRREMEKHSVRIRYTAVV